MHSKHDREYRWAQKIERATDKVDETGEQATTVDVSVNIVLKSETWINGFCKGACPNNCTGNQGGGPEFEYMQKSVNQLAAVVGAVNQVTPSPVLSVATTSRRSVDIDSLIAQKDRNNKSNSRKNNRKTKNRGGCLDMF